MNSVSRKIPIVPADVDAVNRTSVLCVQHQKDNPNAGDSHMTQSPGRGHVHPGDVTGKDFGEKRAKTTEPFWNKLSPSQAFSTESNHPSAH